MLKGTARTGVLLRSQQHRERLLRFLTGASLQRDGAVPVSSPRLITGGHGGERAGLVGSMRPHGARLPPGRRFQSEQAAPPAGRPRALGRKHRQTYRWPNPASTPQISRKSGPYLPAHTGAVLRPRFSPESKEPGCKANLRERHPAELPP